MLFQNKIHLKQSKIRALSPDAWYQLMTFPLISLQVDSSCFPPKLVIDEKELNSSLILYLEKRKQWQPLGICHRLIAFILNSIIARSLVKHETITSPHPKPQGSSNGVVSMEDQQPLVPNRPNGVESVYLQQAQHTPDDNSGFEIQVHYKQIDDDDSKMRNAAGSHKFSSSRSLEEVKPIFTSVSQAKDPKRSLSIAHVAGLEKEKDNKKKGIMLMSKEDATLAMVGEEDESSKRPTLRRTRPLFSVAPNINEKSDEFIRSRKEAMRRSQSLDELPRTF